MFQLLRDSDYSFGIYALLLWILTLFCVLIGWLAYGTFHALENRKTLRCCQTWITENHLNADDSKLTQLNQMNTL